MSHVWNFSPSSAQLYQQCLNVASLHETNNRWTKLFDVNKLECLKENEDQEIIEITPSPHEPQEANVSETYEDYFDNLENKMCLKYISEKCTKNPDLLLKMAQRLNPITTEKLFNLIFDSKNLENQFLLNIFHVFLPNVMKEQNSLQCVDILTKTSNMYLEIFQTLLKILIQDTGLPDQVLFNYVSSLNEENITQFMVTLTKIELSSANFLHNILTIYSAYKGSKKSDVIQSYIKDNLVKHCQSCSLDRNYGRLFLMYLQVEKCLDSSVDAKQLGECLEVHKSSFKRPCVMMLKELE